MTIKPVLLGLVSFGAALVLALLLGPFVPQGPAHRAEGAFVKEVWLTRGPIHPDLVLPLDPETRGALDFMTAPDESTWLVIGWGSRGFYTTTGDHTDLALGTILRAATGDDSVLRVLPVPCDAPSPERLANQSLSLSAVEYSALLTSIAQDVIGPPLAGAHLALGDAFYPTKGRFHIFRTCNQWVAARLRDAGLRLGAWMPTTLGLRASLWWFGHSAF